MIYLAKIVWNSIVQYMPFEGEEEAIEYINRQHSINYFEIYEAYPIANSPKKEIEDLKRKIALQQKQIDSRDFLLEQIRGILE